MTGPFFLLLNKLITFILTQAYKNVLYLIHMSKEVIYLEPEDDITDILTKLQRAEQKLVALVPPKKATILRSAVNMKLVARAAKECKKIVVIVTTDPAILKMAMAAQIPVAKTLQSRPVVPTKESLASASENEQVIDEDMMTDVDKNGDEKNTSAKASAEASRSPSEQSSAKSADIMDISEESLENGSKDGKKASKTPKKGADDKKVPSFEKYRKWIIIGAVAAVFLIVFGVWALVFAPAVKITVAMSTSATNFSEDIEFTTDKNAEDVENGVFYAQKQTVERKYDGEFTPTGREDKGEKATGKVTVAVSFTPKEYFGEGGYDLEIPVGATFVTNSLEYVATSGDTVLWDGEELPLACDNGTLRTASDLKKSCTFSVTISVEAKRSGTQYNLSAGQTWESLNGAIVSNGSPLSGGTTEEVVVVSQVDVDKVKDELIATHSTEGKEMLFSDIKEDEDLIAIEASYETETGEVKSEPAVGSESESGKAPKVTVTQKYSVYTIEKSQVEEYIKSKLSLADDQKIYSIGDPYIERFTKIDEGARLKTIVKTGPTVTEEDILEKVKGKKIGEVQSLLRSINGVSSVNIESSFFWVWSVPKEADKITIDLTMEDK